MQKKGGKREGAGRKRGGHNRYSTSPEVQKRINERGYLDPVDVLLEIANDKQLEPSVRSNAARGAAPYTNRPMPQAVILQAEIEIGGVEIEVIGRRAAPEAAPGPLPVDMSDSGAEKVSDEGKNVSGA